MRKFLVPMWWFEQHYGRVLVEVEDIDEAISKVYDGTIGDVIPEDLGQTWVDFGSYGVDEPGVI